MLAWESYDSSYLSALTNGQIVVLTTDMHDNDDYFAALPLPSGFECAMQIVYGFTESGSTNLYIQDYSDYYNPAGVNGTIIYPIGTVN